MNNIILSAALALAALCAPAYAESDKVRFVISGTSFAFMPLFVADSSGYLEANGIELDLIRSNAGGAGIIATLVGGGADVAVVGMNEVLTARSAGVDLVVLGAVVRQYVTLVTFSKAWAEAHGVTEASPVADKLSALEGIRIATTGHGSGPDLVAYLANLAKLDPERDLTIVPIGTDPIAYYSAIEQGRVDAIALSAPNPQWIKRELGAVIAFNTARGEVKELDGYPYISVSSTRDWANANPELVGRIDQAFVEALTAIKDPASSHAVRDEVHAAHFSQIEKDIFDDAWTIMSQGRRLILWLPKMKSSVLGSSGSGGGYQWPERKRALPLSGAANPLHPDGDQQFSISIIQNFTEAPRMGPDMRKS